MAEYIMKDYIKRNSLENEFYCESRAVSSEESGNDIYPPAKACLKRHNIAFDRHIARKISQLDYEKYDEIYVMDTSNLRYINMLVNDSQNKIKMLLDTPIPDPWYSGDFEGTYSSLIEGIERILNYDKHS